MSIREAAKDEMVLIGMDRHEQEVMLKILDLFFDTWDSGGAVYFASQTLVRLISGQPLSPLTGADDEWIEVGPGVLQNRRGSSVFKDSRIGSYDIDVKEHPPIAFPYDPLTRFPSSPVVEFGV